MPPLQPMVFQQAFGMNLVLLKFWVWMLPAEVDMAVAGPKLKQAFFDMQVVLFVVWMLLVKEGMPVAGRRRLKEVSSNLFLDFHIVIAKAFDMDLGFVKVLVGMLLEKVGLPVAGPVLVERLLGLLLLRWLVVHRRPRHRPSSTRPAATRRTRTIRCCWLQRRFPRPLRLTRCAVLDSYPGVPRVVGPGPAAAGPHGQRHAASRR